MEECCGLHSLQAGSQDSRPDGHWRHGTGLQCVIQCRGSSIHATRKALWCHLKKMLWISVMPSTLFAMGCGYCQGSIAPDITHYPTKVSHPSSGHQSCWGPGGLKVWNHLSWQSSERPELPDIYKWIIEKGYLHGITFWGHSFHWRDKIKALHTMGAFFTYLSAHDSCYYDTPLTVHSSVFWSDCLEKYDWTLCSILKKGRAQAPWPPPRISPWLS